MDKPVSPTAIASRFPGPMPPGLDPRSAAVLREIVEQYVETGEPVGSRTLVAPLPHGAVAGDHPQRDGGPDRRRAAVRPAHLGRAAADRARPAAVRRRPAAIRRARRGGAGARSPPRSAPRGAAWRTRLAEASAHARPACRPPPGWCWRRNREGALQAHRVRPARLRAGAGGAGGGRRAGGEPGDRDARRAAALGLAAGEQLPERPALRAPAGGTAPHRGRGDGGQPHRARCAVVAGGGDGAGHLDRRGPRRQPDRARPGAAARRRDADRAAGRDPDACSSGWRRRRPCCGCWNWRRSRTGVRIFIGAESGLFGPPGCRWWWRRRAARATGSSARSG